MLDPFDAAKRWRYIKEQVNNIPDPLLRDAIMAAYKQRSVEQWGYCPDNTQYKPTKQTPVLDDYEKDLLKRIKMAKEYGYFERDKNIEKKAKNRMSDFIEKGGTYSDLPEDLQNKYIAKLYMDVMFEKIEDCINILEKN